MAHHSPVRRRTRHANRPTVEKIRPMVPLLSVFGTGERQARRPSESSILAARSPQRRIARRGSRAQGGPTVTMKKISILAALALTSILIGACGSSASESDADKFASTAEQQAKTLKAPAPTP